MGIREGFVGFVEGAAGEWTAVDSQNRGEHGDAHWEA